MRKIIEIKDLTFSYGEYGVFENFSLEINEGSFYTVLGPNGSGKSTLARILVGLEPVQGEIIIDDLMLNLKNIEEIRRRIGIVFENPNSQFITETVSEELAFPLENLNYNPEEIIDRVANISLKFGITELLESNPQELSGGEKQLVALASALIYEPKILILDEALGMIDSMYRSKVFDILSTYHKKGLTILNITHDSEECLYGTDILILNSGKNVLQQPLKKALGNEKIFTSSLMELPFIVDLSTKLNYYKVVNKLAFDKKKLVNDLWK